MLMRDFKIAEKLISDEGPTYFIADVASNHDGDMEKAKDLIRAAAEAGADAAKFQHFRASSLISKEGFRGLGGNLAHQSNWSKSVYETYESAETDFSWTNSLREVADESGIDFFSSVYDLDTIEQISPAVDVFKIGSGDLTWREGLFKFAQQKKPVILATGASTMQEVERAVSIFDKAEVPTAILQCNTNYSGSDSVFKNLNLRVISRYKEAFPGKIIGLSDHSMGHTSVLGAISLGARIVEKHFTLDNNDVGPDHAFSMNPRTWQEMIVESRKLEEALGDGVKKVEENERETIIVQRRGLYARNHISQGEVINSKNTMSLRPSLPEQLDPFDIEKGLIASVDIEPNKGIRAKDTFEES